MFDAVNEQVQRVTTLFDSWAIAGRAEGMERGHAPHARRAFARLQLQAGAPRYLDVGCGNGYTVRWAAALVTHENGLAMGLDGSAQMISRARQASVGLPCVFVQSVFPSNDERLVAGTFDGIFSMEVFYYLPDMDAALDAVFRLLRPKGRFVCVVDYYGENVSSHAWPERLGVSMTCWTAAEWRAAFVRAGFSAVEQEFLTTPGHDGEDAWKSEWGSLMTVGERATTR